MTESKRVIILGRALLCLELWLFYYLGRDCMWDIVIIGAGVIGCNIARELAKYDLNICVVEKTSDIATGTTKANSAIIHAGHDTKIGTLKAKLNVLGNAKFDLLSKQLDFPFKRNGSLVLCFEEDRLPDLEALMKNGENNGVPGLEMLNVQKLRELEPNIGSRAIAALHAPTGGIVCPYEMALALAENAHANGVTFEFNTEVQAITKSNDFFILRTNRGMIETKLVINAAGVFADGIHNMVSDKVFEIIPRKGEYCLFDKSVGDTFTHTIFQQPTVMGKGILVTPTVDGNLLIGPNASDIEDKEDISTTQQGLDEILEKAQYTLDTIPYNAIITSFSGLRAHSQGDDFIIGELEDVPGFINVASVESPGLSASPAIAEMVEGIVVNKIKPDKRQEFNPIREGIPRFREMTDEQRKELIQKDSSYGKVICRCETVTEGEIIASIKRPLGATDLDGVKRRTRAGMGRCQAGFCMPKIVDILAEQLNISRLDVTKFGNGSKVLVGHNKEIIHEKGGERCE